jgi:hypothetical protein
VTAVPRAPAPGGAGPPFAGFEPRELQSRETLHGVAGQRPARSVLLNGYPLISQTLVPLDHGLDKRHARRALGRPTCGSMTLLSQAVRQDEYDAERRGLESLSRLSSTSAHIDMTTDEGIAARIEGLVSEEHELRRREQADQRDTDRLEADKERLRSVEVELDRCWDLLRQRRAREEFGQDPHDAEVREAGTVERYLQ